MQFVALERVKFFNNPLNFGRLCHPASITTSMKKKLTRKTSLAVFIAILGLFIGLPNMSFGFGGGNTYYEPNGATFTGTPN